MEEFVYEDALSQTKLEGTNYYHSYVIHVYDLSMTHTEKHAAYITVISCEIYIQAGCLLVYSKLLYNVDYLILLVRVVVMCLYLFFPPTILYRTVKCYFSINWRINDIFLTNSSSLWLHFLKRGAGSYIFSKNTNRIYTLYSTNRAVGSFKILVCVRKIVKGVIPSSQLYLFVLLFMFFIFIQMVREFCKYSQNMFR